MYKSRFCETKLIWVEQFKWTAVIAEECWELVVKKAGGCKPQIGMWADKCCVFCTVDTIHSKHWALLWQPKCLQED